MIERSATSAVLQNLREAPAVCLLGPRQVGKTTLALEVVQQLGGLYLDLESDSDRAKLADPEAYLSLHLDKLVVLDEVHRQPNPFSSSCAGCRRGMPMSASASSNRPVSICATAGSSTPCWGSEPTRNSWPIRWPARVGRDS